MKNQKFRLYRIILPVDNIEIAAGFYSKVLNEPGMRVSPGRHYFNLGGTILACYDPGADGDDKEEWKFYNNQYIYIAVNHLTEILKTIHKYGGQVLSDIQNMPWGETLFYAKDPFGTPLCFVEESTKFMGE